MPPPPLEDAYFFTLSNTYLIIFLIWLVLCHCIKSRQITQCSEVSLSQDTSEHIQSYNKYFLCLCFEMFRFISIINKFIKYRSTRSVHPCGDRKIGRNHRAHLPILWFILFNKFLPDILIVQVENTYLRNITIILFQLGNRRFVRERSTVILIGKRFLNTDLLII